MNSFPKNEVPSANAAEALPLSYRDRRHHQPVCWKMLSNSIVFYQRLTSHFFSSPPFLPFDLPCKKCSFFVSPCLLNCLFLLLLLLCCSFPLIVESSSSRFGGSCFVITMKVSDWLTLMAGNKKVSSLLRVLDNIKP